MRSWMEPMSDVARSIATKLMVDKFIVYGSANSQQEDAEAFARGMEAILLKSPAVETGQSIWVVMEQTGSYGDRDSYPIMLTATEADGDRIRQALENKLEEFDQMEECCGEKKTHGHKFCGLCGKKFQILERVTVEVEGVKLEWNLAWGHPAWYVLSKSLQVVKPGETIRIKEVGC